MNDWTDSTCENCHFQRGGECRINPPAVVVESARHNEGRDDDVSVVNQHETVYPQVRIFHWDGDISFYHACSKYVERDTF